MYIRNGRNDMSTPYERVFIMRRPM